MQNACKQATNTFANCGFCLFYYGISAFKTENSKSKIYIALVGFWISYAGICVVSVAFTVFRFTGWNIRSDERTIFHVAVLYHHYFNVPYGHCF